MMTSLYLILLHSFTLFWAGSVGCVGGTLSSASADLQHGLLIAKPISGVYSETQQISVKGPFRFQLCELKTFGQPVDIFYRGIMADTLYVETITASSIENTLIYPVVVRKNLLGYWICPKCHRADKTLEMVYGDGGPLNLASRKRPQGCINNGTRGYCSRDRISF